MLPLYDQISKMRASSVQDTDHITFIGALQEFYTNASPINELMIAELGDVKGKIVLEPAVGEGAFLSGLMHAQRVDAIDINPASIDVVKSRFPHNVRTIVGDFIDHFARSNSAAELRLEKTYDAVICNPPYGLKFTVEYRKLLKQRFPKMYVRESYGLFLFLSICMLRDGGRFCFIVPDTFLASHNHKPLREFLSRSANIENVYVFNSSRFETVNYGYGSMCIVSGSASLRGQTEQCVFVNSRSSENTIQSGDRRSVDASQLVDKASTGWAAFLSPADREGDEVTLGELAECRTGIYTGDNPRFCSFIGTPPRKINGHAINQSQVFSGALSEKQRLEGIEDGPQYVPLVRGGHWAPFQKQQNYIDWSTSAVGYYRDDKKARLQNQSFYFRTGLAVPMVTSGRISASKMESAVFDQGVVGVFPKCPDDLEVLMVLLNSKYATQSKLKVNPSANNSANYLKRIALPMITNEMREIASAICTKWSKESVIGKGQVENDAEQLFS
jgi:predicted RNA methylase